LTGNAYKYCRLFNWARTPEKPVRFIGRILGLGYLRGSWQELKQVTWPTKRDGRRLTTAVIIFSVIFGAMIALVDFGLDKLFKQILLK
jgi:preprotein translocase SecE subunit